MTTTRYAGDAIVSLNALRYASRAASAQDGLPAVLSLFSLIEAVVLYERLWYLPFGDADAAAARRLAVWEALAGEGLILALDPTALAPDTGLWRAARERWEHDLAALGPTPSYRHISQAELLANTFSHARHAEATTYARVDDRPELLTAARLNRWERHVTGAGFDADAEEANQGDDGGRYMDWERTAISLAHASIVRHLEADFVGDAFEDPLRQISEALVSRNLSARLYAKVSEGFRTTLDALIDDGYAATVAIPPVVALVLERSERSLASIVRATVALRAEFAPFRTKYREYADLLRNPAGRSLADLAAARREGLEEVSGALNKVKTQRSDSRLLSELFGAELKPSDNGSDATLEFDATLSFNALLKLGVEHFTFSRIKGRARILFDVYAKAMQIKNLHALVGSRLGIDLSDAEASAYRAYARRVERLRTVQRRAG